MSPALAAGSLSTEPPGKSNRNFRGTQTFSLCGCRGPWATLRCLFVFVTVLTSGSGRPAPGAVMLHCGSSRVCDL